MRRSRVVVLSLVLAGVCAGCYKLVGFPPYGKPIYIAVVVHNDRGKCTTRTSPQWQPVRRNDELVWEVAGDACAGPKDVTVKFQNSEAVVVDDNRPQKGTAKGACGRYKYSILIKGKVVEDPEIEIWP